MKSIERGILIGPIHSPFLEKLPRGLPAEAIIVGDKAQERKAARKDLRAQSRISAHVVTARYSSIVGPRAIALARGVESQWLIVNMRMIETWGRTNSISPLDLSAKKSRVKPRRRGSKRMYSVACLAIIWGAPVFGRAG